MGDGSGVWLGSFLLWGLFLGLIVAGVVLIGRSWWRPGEDGARAAGERTTTALDLLEERYARGEIDQADFEERRATLLGPGSRRR